METTGAVVFLPRDERGASPFLEDILFDPACLWLVESLKAEGVSRFLAVCDDASREAAVQCFPDGTDIVTTGAEDAPARLAAFLEQVGEENVIVITRPILLAPAGMTFNHSSREGLQCVWTLSAQALAAALQDGTVLDEALTTLGSTNPWLNRCLPLRSDLEHRANVIEPAARSLSVDRLLSAGVRVMDPASTFVGPAVEVGAGSTLLPGTILRGRTTIGTDCVIGPNAMIRDCTLADRVTVNASQLNESTVDCGTTVGPFAYIRPNCKVGRDVKVGDFVELKNSTLGNGTKVSHLTYVGDTDAGERINFGCGTVTVNYDGRNKYRTTIGNDAFIGCNTNLVAPVTVGESAFTAAGSTITDHVPPNALAIARDRQHIKRNWVLRRR